MITRNDDALPGDSTLSNLCPEYEIMSEVIDVL
jgi:hypothetical protein